jgi:hypothetical protein
MSGSRGYTPTWASTRGDGPGTDREAAQVRDQLREKGIEIPLMHAVDSIGMAPYRRITWMPPGSALGCTA